MVATVLACAAATVSAAALTACSGGDLPPPPTFGTSGSATGSTSAPAPDPSVNASSTATPSPPALPKAATALDAQGASAFARYWFDVVNYTYHSGDTHLIRSLSTAECQFCASFVRDTEKATAQGRRTVGADVSVIAAVVPPPSSNDLFQVQALVDQAAGTEVDAVGNVITSLSPNSKARIDVFLRRDTTSWRVRGVVPNA
jgi:Family of unknown function (DUF6318)